MAWFAFDAIISLATVTDARVSLSFRHRYSPDAAAVIGNFADGASKETFSDTNLHSVYLDTPASNLRVGCAKDSQATEAHAAVSRWRSFPSESACTYRRSHRSRSITV